MAEELWISQKQANKQKKKRDKSKFGCGGPCLVCFFPQKELDQGLCHIIKLKQMESGPEEEQARKRNDAAKVLDFGKI